MDRSADFKEIIEIISSNKPEDSQLRNRLLTKEQPQHQAHTTVKEENCQSFLSECMLLNSTLIQLSERIKKVSLKPDQISFTTSQKKSDPFKEIEEALNICSMNISILKNRQINNKEDTNESSNTWWSFRKNKEKRSLDTSIVEHCRLVALFLESRIGRITEDLETHKKRRNDRQKLLLSKDNSPVKNTFSNAKSSIIVPEATTTSTTHNKHHHQQQSVLQLENSRLIEEMSRGLFETLTSTESQVLEVSRLQSTLQSHLQAQHDLTCRLFEDSQVTFEETKRGNEYLKRSGKDSSLMRRFLVSLILFMTLILLMLHYFNK